VNVRYSNDKPVHLELSLKYELGETGGNGYYSYHRMAW